jgi:hypothetical protein
MTPRAGHPPSSPGIVFHALLVGVGGGACRTVDASAAAPTDPQISRATSGEGELRLRLVAPTARKILGEPLVLLAILENSTEEAHTVSDPFEPGYGFLEIWIDAPGGEEPARFQPTLRKDSRGKQPQTLAGGQGLHAWVPVFESRDGWALDAAGRYEAWAEFESDGRRHRSEPASFEIEAPQIDADRLASGIFSTKEVAWFVSGSRFSEDGRRRLETVETKFGESRLAPYASLALGLFDAEARFDQEIKDFREADLARAIGRLATAAKGLDDPYFAAIAVEGLVRCLRRLGRQEEAERAARDHRERHADASSLPGLDDRIERALEEPAAKS